MKSKRINAKKPRGRPVVESAAVNVRIAIEGVRAIDDWRRQQEDLPGRPEAIRRLVELGLKARK